MAKRNMTIETMRQNLAGMTRTHDMYYGANPGLVVTGVEWEDGEWLPTAVWKAKSIMPEAFKDHRHE